MATTLNSTPVIKGKASKKLNEVLVSSKTNKISEDKRKNIFTLVQKVLSKNQN